MNRFSNASRPHQAGFSLVEVTLSIAIIAFAFISLLGLLPAGLKTFQSAVDSTVRSQIGQQIISQAQQTEFSRLSELASSSATDPKYYYFDGDAVALDENRKSQSIYTAAVTYSPMSALPTAATSGHLALVRIEVYANKGIFNGSLPIDPRPACFVAHVADFGLRL